MQQGRESRVPADLRYDDLEARGRLRVLPMPSRSPDRMIAASRGYHRPEPREADTQMTSSAGRAKSGSRADTPYRATGSVLMLREGWDVKK